MEIVALCSVVFDTKYFFRLSLYTFVTPITNKKSKLWNRNT